jgi:hypothetical protein
MTKTKCYAIFDVLKNKTFAEIWLLLQEELREYTEEQKEEKKNVNWDFEWRNRLLVSMANPDEERINKKENKIKIQDIMDWRKKRIEEAKIKERPNGVKAVSYILSYSPEKEGNMPISKWCKKNKEFAIKKHGLQNIMNMVYHGGEKTGHIHLMALPIVIPEKGRFKGQERMDAAGFIGGKGKMIQAHTDYAQEMAIFGLERGQNGSLAKKISPQEYYTNQTEEKNHQERKKMYALIARLKLKLKKVKKWIEEKGLEKELNNILKGTEIA